MNIKICSLNVRGLRNKEKREKMFCWLKEQPYNIILLQETHSTYDINNQWAQEWGYSAFFSGNKSNSKGVGILINKNVTCDILNYFDIFKGRLQAIELKINDKNITIINIYGPNNDEILLFEKLEEFMLLHDDKSIITGGDFNTVLDTEKDKKNGTIDNHKKIRKKLESIINTNNLIDKNLAFSTHKYT